MAKIENLIATRKLREQVALATQLAIHAEEMGEPVEIFVVAGQAAILCRACGYYETVDTIKAEANSGFDKEGNAI